MISRSGEVLKGGREKLDFESKITLTPITYILYIVEEISLKRERAETVVFFNKFVIIVITVIYTL